MNWGYRSYRKTSLLPSPLSPYICREVTGGLWRAGFTGVTLIYIVCYLTYSKVLSNSSEVRESKTGSIAEHVALCSTQGDAEAMILLSIPFPSSVDQ